MHGKCEKCIQILAKNPALGKPTHGWEYNIKICLQDVGWKGLDWILSGSRWGFLVGCF
jgi:hypothetical protein